MQGTWSIPGLKPSHMPRNKRPGRGLQNHWASVLQPWAGTTAAHVHIAHILKQGKPAHWGAHEPQPGGPLLARAKDSLCSSGDPVPPKEIWAGLFINEVQKAIHRCPSTRGVIPFIHAQFMDCRILNIWNIILLYLNKSLAFTARWIVRCPSRSEVSITEF